MKHPGWKALENAYRAKMKDADGRISRDNKAWAKTIPMPEDSANSQPVSYTHLDVYKRQYLSCLSEIKGNGFPEETRRLTEQLSEPAFRQTLKEEYAAFWTAYQQDRDLLRFHYHSCLLYTSRCV